MAHLSHCVALVVAGLVVGCGDDEPEQAQAGEAGGSGAMGGGGATGGSGATGGAGGSGGVPGTCPATGGPTMVNLAAGFCIDSTEVTRTQYETWLMSNPSTDGQPSTCQWNVTYTPFCEWPPGTNGEHPVVCVDWCDAYAYCAGVGKQLCGAIGGGPTAFDDYDDATKSQWYAACSSAGESLYPYGNAYDGRACNGVDYPKAGTLTLPVASLDTCQAPAPGFGGVYDLSGNVAEWEDACEPFDNVPNGQVDYCRIRGGGYSDSGVDDRFNGDYNILACVPSAGVQLAAGRGIETSNIGFRCCAPRAR